jgi:hypothetical protein
VAAKVIPTKAPADHDCFPGADVPNRGNSVTQQFFMSRQRHQSAIPPQTSGQQLVFGQNLAPLALKFSDQSLGPWLG